jgi:hypothetical protein
LGVRGQLTSFQSFSEAPQMVVIDSRMFLRLKSTRRPDEPIACGYLVRSFTLLDGPRSCSMDMAVCAVSAVGDL